jgi:two-component system, OmpR family, response regulator
MRPRELHVARTGELEGVGVSRTPGLWNSQSERSYRGCDPSRFRQHSVGGESHSRFESPAISQQTLSFERQDVHMPGAHLLIVDDEDNLRSMLAAALRHHGFEVSTAENGRQALEIIPREHPDLVLLDVMMPELDGFEVCRRLRFEGDRTPVLFLTARDSTDDKVRGLTLGGDDYLQKPFSLDELVARAEAVLRRTTDPHRNGTVLACADLRMDDDAHRVQRDGEDVSLSPTEYNLLRYLLLNQGRVLSKAQILDHVWKYDFGGDGGVVETYVGYLRKKVDHVEPKLIHTIRGVGYTLRPG